MENSGSLFSGVVDVHACTQRVTWGSSPCLPTPNPAPQILQRRRHEHRCIPAGVWRTGRRTGRREVSAKISQLKISSLYRTERLRYASRGSCSVRTRPQDHANPSPRAATPFGTRVHAALKRWGRAFQSARFPSLEASQRVGVQADISVLDCVHSLVQRPIRRIRPTPFRRVQRPWLIISTTHATMPG